MTFKNKKGLVKHEFGCRNEKNMDGYFLSIMLVIYQCQVPTNKIIKDFLIKPCNR